MSYDAELSKKVYNCKTVLNVELDQNNAIESKKKKSSTLFVNGKSKTRSESSTYPLSGTQTEFMEKYEKSIQMIQDTK